MSAAAPLVTSILGASHPLTDRTVSRPTPQIGGFAPMAATDEMAALGLTLHPLVVINISDHFTRARCQTGGTGVLPRVFGILIGEQTGRRVEVANSFETKVVPNGEHCHPRRRTHRASFAGRARASFARRARKKARNAHARPRSSGSRDSQRVAARCPSSRTFARGSNST